MSELLPEGVDIKPFIQLQDVHRIIDQIYGMKVSQVNELNAYDDRNYHVKVTEISNPHVMTPSPYGYVLKIMNSIDSKNSEIFDGQTQLLLELSKGNKIVAPVPIKNIRGDYFSLETYPNSQGNKNVHIIRMLEFCPGQILKNASTSCNIYAEIGEWLGKLQNDLESFHHSVYDVHRTIWHLQSAPQLTAFTHVISNTKHKKIVEQVINSFIENVTSKLSLFPSGIIHGDFNEQNILVSDDGSHVCAILDFGDAHWGPYLFDVAVCICYMMIEARRKNLKITDVAMATLNGYEAVRKINLWEKQLLKVCICARLCQSLVLGLYSSTLHPENGYIRQTQKDGWHVLEELWHIQDNDLPWMSQ